MRLIDIVRLLLGWLFHRPMRQQHADEEHEYDEYADDEGLFSLLIASDDTVQRMATYDMDRY